MTTSAHTRYKGHRFPAEVIGHAVWLYFRFPLGLRMVEELLAARGTIAAPLLRVLYKIGESDADSGRTAEPLSNVLCRRRKPLLIPGPSTRHAPAVPAMC
jgi:hypothetical protein